MTAKTIAHAEQFAVVAKERSAHPVAHSEPFAVVVSDDERCAVIVTAGAQGPVGVKGEIGPAGGTAFERTAGEALSALKVVWEDDQGVVYALDYADEAHIDLLAGLSITSSAAGSSITIQRGGPIDAGGLNLTPGRVWLGLEGALTQIPPVDGFDFLVGYATAGQRLYIDFSDNIQLTIEE